MEPGTVTIMPSNDPHPDAAAPGELLPGDVQQVPPSQASGVRDAGRYVLGAPVAGDVHQGRDRLLDRAVHIRVSDNASAADLEREARFIARLEHPGIAPVHDLVRGDGGSILVMRAVEGVSLADAIRDAKAGNVRAELSCAGSVVQVFKRICDTLSAAHARHVVHRNLSPAAISLGWHGQVVVGGWTDAMQEAERPMTLRFVAAATAAPQALNLDDLHTDVRSVGACLFEALALRPLPAGHGRSLGNLSEDEKQRIPPPLEAIIRFAVSSDQTIGYHNMAELGDDLGHFLNGINPISYRPGLPTRIGSWMRGHPRSVIAAALLVLAAVGAGVGVWYGVDRYRDRWADPIVNETFDDDSWRLRWIESGKGSFSVESGRLVSQAPRHANLIFKQRLATPVAIEYTGQMLPGSKPCDLSVVWSERDGLPDSPARMADGARSYLIQAGANDNTFCGMIQLPGYRRVAHVNRQLEVGRSYRFRVEIEAETISMSIDGERIYEYRDVFPSTSGYIALYGYYPGKAFDDVRIMQKESPTQVPAIATGDSLYQFRHFADAASVYGRLADSDPQSAAGQLARFRKGIAEVGLGRRDTARETWSQLSDVHLLHLADCMGLEDLLETWQVDLLMTRFESWYHDRPDVRNDLRLAWQRLMGKLRYDPRIDEPLILRFIALREKLFPEHSASAGEATSTLLALGRFEDILNHYPDEHVARNEALFALGLIDEVKGADGVLKRDWARTHIIRGEFDKVFQVPGVGPETLAYTLCKLGRAEEALRLTGEDYPTLIHLGRAKELLDAFRTRTGAVDFQTNEALIATGLYEEAAGPGWPGLPNTGSSIRARILLGHLDDADKLWVASNYWHNPVGVGWARLLVAAEAGKQDQVTRWRASAAPPKNLSRPSGWFAGVVIGPFIDRMGGEAGALHASLEHAILTYPRVFARSAWFFSSYVLGKISEDEMLAMPSVSDAPAWLAVGKGLRAELEDHPADALAAYRSFADLPRHKRLLDGNTLDVQVELFVAWRLRALAK
jgi:serine/threonine protein kinase